jgi:PAS domain S-box-containing protein
MKPDLFANAAELRCRAEERLDRKQGSLTSEEIDQRTEADLRRLRHELEVHQIELEMQNEELQRAQAETEAALGKYTDLYDFAPTGYFTLAGDGTILAVNLTGARLVGIERARLLNRRLTFLISIADRSVFNAFLKNTFAGKGREFCEVTLTGEGASPLIVRIEAVVSKDGRECRAAVMDVTERHQAAVERNRMIEELQQTLARVNLLSGMLPICANCKKIRDDQGYWKQVESYIATHSEATFTHGLCPECVTKLYPGLVITKETTP